MPRRAKRKNFSVIQPGLSECYICGNPNVAWHEVFEGTANRQKSIKWGMVIALCPWHHNTSNYSFHYNKDMQLRIKQEAQRKFQEVYPDEDFIEIFGKNYL